MRDELGATAADHTVSSHTIPFPTDPVKIVPGTEPSPLEAALRRRQLESAMTIRPMRGFDNKL
jgi:hypothetical protein